MSLKNLILALFVTGLFGNLQAQRTFPILNKAADLYDGHRVVYQVLASDTNILHGRYTYYYFSKKVVEGEYHSGKKHGTWKRFYRNGNVSAQAHYIRNRKHGKWEFYFTDGSLRAQLYFEENKRTGDWKGFFYGGYLAIEQHYQADTLFGDQKRYYHPTETEDKRVVPVLKELYRANGDKTYYERYYPSGKIFEKITKVKGKYEGIQERYYPNTLLWGKFKYTAGRLDAIYDYNNPIGRDHDRSTFRNGSGELKLYHGNGELYCRVDMRSGLANGKITYYRNELREAEGYMRNGERDGTWKIFDVSTNKRELIAEIHYFTPDSAHALYYHGDGKARSEGNLMNGKKEGIWRSYDMYDELEYETQYLLGMEHGIVKSYNPGMIVDENGGYFYDLKVGNWGYYNDFGGLGYKEEFKNQVFIEESYFQSDSTYPTRHLERAFFGMPKSVSLDERIGVYVGYSRTMLTFDSYLLEGRFRDHKYRLEFDEQNDYDDAPVVLDPTLFVPDMQVAVPSVENYDLGLLLKTLNPVRLRNKKDRTDPKIGVGMVQVELDEFGSVIKARTLRGIDPYWDRRLLQLYTQIYPFWEPAWVGGLPISVLMEEKIPVEYLEVKKLKK